MDSPLYAKFDISETAYKVVNNQEIKAYVLTPKNISSGKHPIVVKFHGGFFITGASLFPDWYPPWALDYCLLHSAIIVTGDYRLLPESTGLDMREDVLDFWDWIRKDLQPFLNDRKPGVEADLTKVIVHGESAGGAISLLSGFWQPSGFIKAVISMYPYIDLAPKREKPILGIAPGPESVVQNHLKSIQPGKIVTAAFPPERMDITIPLAQSGDIAKYYGTDERLNAWKLLERASDMPYTLILHGEEDTAVPVEGSLRWEAAAKAKFGGEKVTLHVEPGKEHGFDCAVPLETPWLKGYLAKVTELWLGRTEK